MKLPEDKFEQSLKERLSNIKGIASSDAKANIFAAIPTHSVIVSPILNIFFYTITTFLVLIPQLLFVSNGKIINDNMVADKTMNQQNLEEAFVINNNKETLKKENTIKLIDNKLQKNVPVNANEIVDDSKGLTGIAVNQNVIYPTTWSVDSSNTTDLFYLEGRFPSTDISNINHLNISDSVIVLAAPKKPGKTSVYLSYMPYLTYNNVSPNRSDEHLINDFNSKPTLSTDRLGWRASLGLNHDLNEKWSSYVGLSVNYFKVALEYSISNVANQTFQATETNLLVPEDNSTDIMYEEAYLGGGIMLGIVYFIKSDVLFDHSFDFSIDYQRRLNKYSNPLLGENQLFANLGYKMSCSISSRFELKAQPNLGYNLMSQDAENQVLTVQPFNVGLDIAVHYRFLK